MCSISHSRNSAMAHMSMNVQNTENLYSNDRDSTKLKRQIKKTSLRNRKIYFKKKKIKQVVHERPLSTLFIIQRFLSLIIVFLFDCVSFFRLNIFFLYFFLFVVDRRCLSLSLLQFLCFH